MPGIGAKAYAATGAIGLLNAQAFLDLSGFGAEAAEVLSLRARRGTAFDHLRLAVKPWTAQPIDDPAARSG